MILFAFVVGMRNGVVVGGSAACGVGQQEEVSNWSVRDREAELVHECTDWSQFSLITIESAASITKQSTANQLTHLT